MPAARSASVDEAGLKTNARSLRDPSPLMSPLTRGVYGCPDCMRRMPVTSSHGRASQVSDPLTPCRRSRSLVVVGRMLGSPPVVGDEKPPCALPPENDDWSVECV